MRAIAGVCGLAAFSTVQAADIQLTNLSVSPPPAAVLKEAVISKQHILTEMWARVDHCATLKGYVDERTGKDNTPEQVRVTLYQMPDGYDCFGAGEQTLEAISQIRHRPPVVVHQRMRR